MRSCRFSRLRFHPEYFPAVTFAFLNTGVKSGSWILGMFGHEKRPQIYVFQPQFPLVKPSVLELYQCEGTENDSLRHNRLSSGVFLIFEATVCCILLHRVFFPHASDIP